MEQILSNVNKFKLSPTDKYIIKKIRFNVNQFLEMSISSFAQHIFCSISALSRLTSKLDFKNYSMFKLFVMNELTSIKNKNNDLFVKVGNKKMKDLASIYIETISKNILPNNEATIKKLSDDISTTYRIISYGSGSSSVSAKHLDFNLKRLGLDSVYESDIHKTIHNILDKKFKQILILFSKDLNSKEIRFLLKISEKINIKTYIFSSNKDVLKIKRDNIIMFSHLQQEKWKFSISSKIASLFNVDLLLLYLYEKNKFNLEDKKIIDMWNQFK